MNWKKELDELSKREKLAEKGDHIRPETFQEITKDFKARLKKYQLVQYQELLEHLQM